jgi:hypothetical protein
MVYNLFLLMASKKQRQKEEVQGLSSNGQSQRVKQTQRQKTAEIEQQVKGGAGGKGGGGGGGVRGESDGEKEMMLHWAAGTNCTSVLQRGNNGYRHMRGEQGWHTK